MGIGQLNCHEAHCSHQDSAFFFLNKSCSDCRKPLISRVVEKFVLMGFASVLIAFTEQ